MDKIFDRFGVYDFFGIWGPGALTVSYTLFTAPALCRGIAAWLGFSSGVLDQDFLWLLLYSAGAYLVGLILHDTTKILFNWFPGLKNANVSKADLKGIMKSSDSIPSLADALTHVKYLLPGGTDRIDRYHACYGMARSLWLAFAAHLVLMLFVQPFNGGLILIDLLLSVVEIYTAEHYYRAWVRNVYIQYFLCIKNERN